MLARKRQLERSAKISESTYLFVTVFFRVLDRRTLFINGTIAVDVEADEAESVSEIHDRSLRVPTENV